MDDTITVAELAEELGHDDDGYAIRRFIHEPDDGLDPIITRLLDDPWILTREQADRIRERFT